MDWKPTYDKNDLDFSTIVKSFVVLFALIAAAVIVVCVQLAGFRRAGKRLEPAPSVFANDNRNRLPPLPRLQIDPPSELAALRAHEDDILTHYAWIDRDAGVVRLPIKRAIALIAQEGRPARGGAAKSASAAKRGAALTPR